VKTRSANSRFQRTAYRRREDDDDYFSQPGKLFRLMRPEQQAGLFANTGRAMGDAPMLVKLRHIGNCLKADPAHDKGGAMHGASRSASRSWRKLGNKQSVAVAGVSHCYSRA